MPRILSCIVGLAALFFVSETSSAAVVITDDRGGPVGSYLERFASIRDAGETVVVDGPCYSACTLVLGLIPRKRLCLTPNAVFGFHAAVANETESGSAATRMLMEFYPGPVRAVIRRHGGLTTKLLLVPGHELFGSVRRCSAKDAELKADSRSRRE